MIIGITGMIASGKTTVSRMLEACGARVIDADKLARLCMDKEGESYGPVLDAFGPQILDEEGQIDRKALGDRVFSSPEDRRRLESLTHPCILGKIKEELGKAELKKVTILEASLLVEAGLVSWVDRLWITQASEKTRLSRLMARSQLSEKEALLRMRAQKEGADKEALADRIIDTEMPIRELRRRVEGLYDHLLDRADK